MLEILEKEKISKLIIRYSLPALVAMGVNILYNLADRFFIGYYIGRLGIAGVSLTMPIATLNLATGLLFGIGSGVLMSINLGKKDLKRGQNILGNGICLLFLVGLLQSILLFLFTDKVILGLGGTGDLFPYTFDYLKPLSLGIFLQVMYIGTNEMIIGSGAPKKAMFIGLIGCLTNIILDPIFINIFNLGMKGAALATIIGNFVAVTFQLIYLNKYSPYLKLNFKELSLKWNSIIELSTIGMPAFLVQFFTAVVVILTNIILKNLGGDLYIAAFGILSSLYLIIFLPIVAIYQGTQPILGYNYGRENISRVEKICKKSLIYSTAIATLGFFIIILANDSIINIFVNTDEQLKEVAINSSKIYFSMIFFLGINVIGAGYFQAIGKFKTSLILNISKQVILTIPLIFILSWKFGIPGVWLATALTEILMAIITLFYLKRENIKIII
ncbi:MATE family efflux transporter (plasmid) [Cetobacterium somerae]|uniref:MATE family efflux transporter n=1 Tax=Cetobacterium somerae TaxID=188913 RepID=UPI003D76859D